LEGDLRQAEKSHNLGNQVVAPLIGRNLVRNVSNSRLNTRLRLRIYYWTAAVLRRYERSMLVPELQYKTALPSNVMSSL
jgi:hypothetical protein